MDEAYLKKIIVTFILVVLIVLSFFLLKPILLSIVAGFILAFVFYPSYIYLNKYIKNKNFSAFLICSLLILLFILPIWFLTPIFIDQSLKIYFAAQKADFVTPLKNIFPSLLRSEEFSAEVGSILHSFTTRIANSLVNSFSQVLLNFPTIFLQFLVIFFTFFFFLRDKEQFESYMKSLLPFPKDVENKLFKNSKEITTSVIYGQVVIGILQGIVVGVGFFIFKVPNALLLTLLASLAGIFPIIGTTIIWLPVAIYLFASGNSFAGIGITIFGIISSTFDNIIRPAFVSKRTSLHPSLVLIGMIGGLFLFGFLGFILGPLIIAFLIIILEIYRDKNIPGVFIKTEEKSNNI